MSSKTSKARRTSEKRVDTRVKQSDKPIDPPYAKDFRKLIQTYIIENTTKLGPFKDIWKRLRFSRIHEGISDDANAQEFLQELYTACLGYLIVPNPFAAQVAALYTMYYLYETQSHTPKVKINISIEIFEQILEKRKQAASKGVTDLYHVLNRLHDLEAYAYVAYIKVDPIISNLNPPNPNAKILKNTEVQSLPPHLLQASALKNIGQMQNLMQLSAAYSSVKSSILKDPTINTSSVDLSPQLSLCKPKFVQDLLEVVNIHLNTNEQRMIKFREEWRKEVQKENSRLNRMMAKAASRSQDITIEENGANTSEEDNTGGWVQAVIQTISSRVTSGAETPTTIVIPTIPQPQPQPSVSPSPSPMADLVRRRQARDFIDDFLLSKQVPISKEDLENVDNIEDEEVQLDIEGNVIIPTGAKKSRKKKPTIPVVLLDGSSVVDSCSSEPSKKKSKKM